MGLAYLKYLPTDNLLELSSYSRSTRYAAELLNGRSTSHAVELLNEKIYQTRSMKMPYSRYSSNCWGVKVPKDWLYRRHYFSTFPEPYNIRQIRAIVSWELHSRVENPSIFTIIKSCDGLNFCAKRALTWHCTSSRTGLNPALARRLRGEIPSASLNSRPVTDLVLGLGLLAQPIASTRSGFESGIGTTSDRNSRCFSVRRHEIV